MNLEKAVSHGGHGEKTSRYGSDGHSLLGAPHFVRLRFPSVISVV